METWGFTSAMWNANDGGATVDATYVTLLLLYLLRTSAFVIVLPIS